jgi:hypothetical protein
VTPSQPKFQRSETKVNEHITGALDSEVMDFTFLKNADTSRLISLPNTYTEHIYVSLLYEEDISRYATQRTEWIPRKLRHVYITQDFVPLQFLNARKKTMRYNELRKLHLSYSWKLHFIFIALGQVSSLLSDLLITGKHLLFYTSVSMS